MLHYALHAKNPEHGFTCRSLELKPRSVEEHRAQQWNCEKTTAFAYGRRTKEVVAIGILETNLVLDAVVLSSIRAYVQVEEAYMVVIKAEVKFDIGF